MNFHFYKVDVISGIFPVVEVFLLGRKSSLNVNKTWDIYVCTYRNK